MWLYGQGGRASIFRSGESRDSLTGIAACDKYKSNLLVSVLASGVVHGIAHNAHAAGDLARKLGFPSSSADRLREGNGVTAHIRTEDELRRAFEKRCDLSRAGHRGTHVAGTIIASRWSRHVRMGPRRCPADHGRRNAPVAELSTRGPVTQRRSHHRGIPDPAHIDADMLDVLDSHGLTLDDRPPPGVSVPLRSIANTAAGGTSRIARRSSTRQSRHGGGHLARLPSRHGGIDFITTDIAESWHDRLWVVEVNATRASRPTTGPRPACAQVPRGRRRPHSMHRPGRRRRRSPRAHANAFPPQAGVGQTDATIVLMAGQERQPSGKTLARGLRRAAGPSCEASSFPPTPLEIDARVPARPL